MTNKVNDPKLPLDFYSKPELKEPTKKHQELEHQANKFEESLKKIEADREKNFKDVVLTKTQNESEGDYLFNQFLKECEDPNLKTYFEDKKLKKLTLEIVDKIESFVNKSFDRSMILDCLNVHVIRNILNTTFWSPTKKNYFFINYHADGDLLQFGQKEFNKYAIRNFGNPIKEDLVKNILKSFLDSNERMDRTEKTKFRNKVLNAPMNLIMEYINFYNQRSNIEIEVDMFTKVPRVEIVEDKARVVYPHVFCKPSIKEEDINLNYIYDFEEHFPEFRQFLNAIISSRFSSDRKKAYLWLHAKSDFGKGVLTSCFDSLGLITELSVKEVEKIMEGDNIAKSMINFKRSFITVFNEFKHVKSELKQLENSISLAPKYSLEVKVNLYFKLFLSAENVESLCGENGVEDQFANRFSYIRNNNSIDDRPLFDENNDEYVEHLTAWIGYYINERVEIYQELGKKEASKEATKNLRAFHSEKGISNYFNKISESMDDIIEDAKKELINLHSSNPKYCVFHNGYYHFKKASKLVSEFINDSFAGPELYTMLKKKTEIIEFLSFDKKGVRNHKVRLPSGDEKQMKCLKIKA